ncbi:hypothetical protein JQ615_12510 [Bradyrhizobium jicamae]|uniref:Uncharacterized protein n=1 Tax=Bradyrhizobium jicamae TaxID=280332 RepID=A0ABS5FHH1_9BRAD|nr:hypothetical protein [Bradyrhizobium jicamae]MBR0796211.1 hypothetical protein [Bradyrhizobium jicamae]MBR0937762.1 hypothetical protein [Bradyrhizobium jicamae]
MPKAARIPTSVPFSSTSKPTSKPMTKRASWEPRVISSTPEDSDSSQLVAVALFSGIGLLISLVAVMLGVQGAWF